MLICDIDLPISKAEIAPTAAYHSPGFGERYAYQVALALSVEQKPIGRSMSHISIRNSTRSNPNLVDDDIFDGRQNMHGNYRPAGYALERRRHL